MKVYVQQVLTLIPALAICSGCGTAPSTPDHLSPATASVDPDQFKLTAEPDHAVGVIDALESASEGDPLVLVGRVGGSNNPWVDGRAAFTVIDASMNVVSEGSKSGEGEVCMGDCCAAERLDCTALVKVVDEQGALVPIDTRDLLGLKESDMVVLQGQARRDDIGNFVMLASGVFIRK